MKTHLSERVISPWFNHIIGGKTGSGGVVASNQNWAEPPSTSLMQMQGSPVSSGTRTRNILYQMIKARKCTDQRELCSGRPCGWRILRWNWLKRCPILSLCYIPNQTQPEQRCAWFANVDYNANNDYSDNETTWPSCAEQLEARKLMHFADNVFAACDEDLLKMVSRRLNFSHKFPPPPPVEPKVRSMM